MPNVRNRKSRFSLLLLLCFATLPAVCGEVIPLRNFEDEAQVKTITTGVPAGETFTIIPVKGANNSSSALQGALSGFGEKGGTGSISFQVDGSSSNIDQDNLALSFFARGDTKTNKVQVVFQEQGGTSWGIGWGREITLSPEWKKYVIPLKSLRCGWERAEQFNLGKSYSLGFYLGAWLFPGKSGPYTIAIDEIELVPIDPADVTSIVASEQWLPIHFSKNTIAGSALDLSFLLDAPAGKYGRVIAKGDHFVFENAPSKSCRFYGVNICFWRWPFFNKEEADIMAERLAAFGFNLVRLTAFEQTLTRKDGNLSTELDSAAMDRLEYFVHALKNRGIYITIDLYIHRKLKPGELSGIENPGRWDLLKTAIPVMDEALENWQLFSKKLLTHVNPYEKLAWKDDPALIGICCVNEGTMTDLWKWKDSFPQIKAIYDAKFKNWLQRRNISELSAENESKHTSEFLAETYSTAYEKMSSFLRGIGVKTLLTDQNRTHSALVTILRNPYDYVDTHFYFDYPTTKDWSKIHNKSVLETMSWNQKRTFPTRLFGKPFAITEFNWCFPNQYRAEAGPIAGAYAALQDWGLMCIFTYGDEDKLDTAQPITTFRIANDPVALLSYRAMSLLYLRGDVKTSELKIPMLLSPGWVNADNDLGSPFPPELASCLGLVGRIGTLLTDKGLSDPFLALGSEPGGNNAINLLSDASDEQKIAQVRKLFPFAKGDLDLKNKYARSSTGELEMDGKNKTFKAVTPKSEALVMCQPGELTGKEFSVVNENGSATFLAASLDDAELKNSNRILFLHLTGATNSKIEFTNSSMKEVLSEGGTPILIRKGKARISLNLVPGETPVRIYGLDMDGKRIGELPTTITELGRVSFVSESLVSGVPCLAYELVRTHDNTPFKPSPILIKKLK